MDSFLLRQVKEAEPALISLRKSGCDASSEQSTKLILDDNIPEVGTEIVVFLLTESRQSLLSLVSKPWKKDKNMRVKFKILLFLRISICRFCRRRCWNRIFRVRGIVLWVLQVLDHSSFHSGMSWILLSSFYSWGNWGTEIEVKQSARGHTAGKWDLSPSKFIPESLPFPASYSAGLIFGLLP